MTAGAAAKPVATSETASAAADASPRSANAAGPAAPPLPGSPSASSGFVGHAILVSGMTLISRALGLVRDAVMAATLGRGSVSDAFYLAFLVPNLFRRLFGEGALTASFIPVYAELQRHDPLAARRAAAACIALLCIVTGGITLLGELGLGIALAAGAAGAETALTLKLCMIMLPYMPLICLVALVGGMLQVHGRFGPAAAAPVLLNVAMIAGALLAGGLAVPLEADLPRIATVIAIAVLVAGVLQLAWQLIAIRRITPLWAPLAGSGTAVRAVVAAMVPMLLGLGIMQINTLVDGLLAVSLTAGKGGADSFFLLGREVAYPVEHGGYTVLQYAQRLYQFPLGVFGIALATAIFPALAHAAAVRHAGVATAPAPHPLEPQPDDFRRILQHGLRLTIFIGLPASVGLIMVRVPLARTLFERGRFTLDDSLLLARILAGYAAGVWAYSATHVLVRAFHAVRDTVTPVRIGAVMVAANIVLNVALLWVLGAAGLAWATALCAALQLVLLVRKLEPIAGRVVDAEVLRGWVRSAALSLAMALALAGMTSSVDPAGLSREACAALLLAMVLVGVVLYAVGARLLGMPELGWLLKRRV